MLVKLTFKTNCFKKQTNKGFESSTVKTFHTRAFLSSIGWTLIKRKNG